MSRVMKNGTGIEMNIRMNLTNLINESREVAKVLNEVANQLEQIDKKYSEDSEDEV